MKKAKKLPKLFRKPIPDRKLNKKFFRRIHLESEAAFLKNKLKKNAAGSWFLDPSDFNADESKRLARLAKAIKKNRGLLVGWKATILLVAAVAVAGFNFFLKDRLFEQAAESALQSVFGAKVELTGAEFSPIAGRISFDHLSVADRQEPMQNLFELGSSRLSVNTGLLLSRRLVIEEAAVGEIRFSTPRESSGALEPKDSPTAADFEPAKEGKMPGLVTEAKELSLEVGQASADRLIEQYRSSLSSPPLIEGTSRRYEESRERWEQTTDTLEGQVDELRRDTETILDTDLDSLDTAGEIKDYLQTLDRAKSQVRETRSEIRATRRDFESDTAYIEESAKAIDAAIEEDAEFLRESVGSFGGDALDAVAASARPIIAERLGPLYEYGEKIVRIAGRMGSKSGDSESGASEKRFADRRRRGSVVSFPLRDYPAFLLRQLTVTTGPEGSEDFTSFEIRDLTNDQDTWGKPTVVGFATTPSPETIDSRLTVDTREEAERLLRGELSLADLPFSYDGNIPGLSITEITASSFTRIDLGIRSDLSGTGEGRIELADLQVGFDEGRSPAAEALREILTDVDRTFFDFSFTFEDGTMTALEVSTDLDSILSDRVGDYLRGQAEEAAAQVEEALYDALGPELAKNSGLISDIRDAGGTILAQEDRTAAIESMIEKRRTEAEAKIQAEVDARTEELKDKAGETIKDLGKDIKIPSF